MSKAAGRFERDGDPWSIQAAVLAEMTLAAARISHWYSNGYRQGVGPYCTYGIALRPQASTTQRRSALYDLRPGANSGNPMIDSMYTASVPVFTQMLGGLDDVLRKAQGDAAERNIEPDALTQSRLYPDMFPLNRQVQIACDFARGVCARLAGSEVPTNPDNEQTFDELRALIARTLAFVGGFDATKFVGSAEREIVLRPGTPKEKRLTGERYLLNYGLPQFFFHVTTAYALLRHNGVPIGKRDYTGVY